VAGNCSERDTFVFYFSGHGERSNNGTLFLYIDRTDADQLPFTGVSITHVIEPLQFCRARNKMLILDCCHAGAAAANQNLLKSSEIVPMEDVTQYNKQYDNFIVLAASGRLEKARELDAINGSFLTSRLCSALRDPNHSTVDKETSGVSLRTLLPWLEKEAVEHNNSTKRDLWVPVPYSYGTSKGPMWLTITAADWKPAEIDWPDGTTMVILPISPVRATLGKAASAGAEIVVANASSGSDNEEFALCIGKHPVTNAQYRRIMETEPVGELVQSSRWEGAFHPFRDDRFKCGDKPVVCVTHEDCEKYASRVNDLGRSMGKFSMLPTIGLWEYSAFRTEHSSRDPNIWRKFKPRPNPESASPLDIDQSGQSANDLGITDLIGNVWEWCVDRSKGMVSMRGGGYSDDPASLVPFKDLIPAGAERIARSDLGFRLAGLIRLDQLPEYVRSLLKVSRKLEGEDFEHLELSNSRHAPNGPVTQSPRRRVAIPPGYRLQRPVRILIAASEGLENELAIVRETLNRSPLTNVPVNLFEWSALLREWSSSQQTTSYHHPPISPYDGVVLLAGMNSTGLSAVSDLFDAAKYYVTDRSCWLVYNITSAPDPEATKPLQKLAEGISWITCTAKEFGDRFFRDHQELVLSLVHPRQTDDLVQQQVANPYRGLESYGLENAKLFYGRSEEVSELRNTLAERSHGLLAVVGASGAGKSSLVRAGLIYRLTLDAIPGSSHWSFVEVIMSKPPLASTAAALYVSSSALRREFRDPTAFEASLSDSRAHSRIVELALAGLPSDARLVLFFDQFEQVFALEGSTPSRFFRMLRDLIAHPRVYVILTIRADFYTDLMETELGKIDEAKKPFWLRSIDQNSMFKVVYWPAVASGLRFENEDLVRQILADCGSGAGSLPLLSFAMNQLVDRTLPNTELTRAAYNELGGVKGAIQKIAVEVFEKHNPTPETMSRLFSRLVHINEDETATKTIARFDRNDSKWTDEEVKLMHSLVDARLLCTDKPQRDAASFTLEIAHEALLNHWDVLTDWVTRSRNALRTMQTAERAAKDWETTLAESRQPRGTNGAQPGPEGALQWEREIDLGRQHFWPQERLNTVREAMNQLGIKDETLKKHVRDFIRDERDRLLEELNHPIGHKRRAEIGAKLADLGDPRPGVGVRNDGTPELAWCKVPPGKITLYDDDGRDLGKFDVAQIWISKYELTLAQFNGFTGSSAYYEDRWWAGLAVQPSKHNPYPQPTPLNCPAQFVSWYQAVAFCRWLSEQLHFSVRLPTEWEWVQAATGGRADYKYSWGADWDEAKCSHRGGVRHITAVGLYPKEMSPVGALDMIGNVFEWCLNEYDRPDVIDVSGENARTTRGGGYFSPPEHCTVDFRQADRADGTKDDGHRIAVGIRLVAEDPPADALFYTGN
jgi:formylglycine-generating enzyme required for sulfatase activity